MAGSSNSLTSRVWQEYGSGATSRRTEVVTIDWVADDAAATIPNLSIELRGYCVKAITNPGATAPTDNYDIALGDPEDSALDALAGALQNRDTTTTEQAQPVITSAQTPVLLAGTYTLSVSGNAVNSATGRIIFYLTDSV